jgi:hypothetical protein
MCEQALKRFLHTMTSNMRNTSKNSNISKNMMNVFSKSLEKETHTKTDLLKEICEKK